MRREKFIFFIISLVLSMCLSACDNLPTSSFIDSVDPEVWCELNFQLKIRIIDFESHVQTKYFIFEVFTYNQIKTLESNVEVTDRENEWVFENVDGFKTGNKQYRFRILSYSRSTLYAELKITAPAQIIVSPEGEFFYEGYLGVGDRKEFKFKLKRVND